MAKTAYKAFLTQLGILLHKPCHEKTGRWESNPTRCPMVITFFMLNSAEHEILTPHKNQNTVMILSFRTDRSEQTVQTQTRLLLEEQSDQGLHRLLFNLHLFDEIP